MALNPVEQRLAQLAGHWEDFRSDSDKRLLVWQADDNALRFYQCFFEVQKHDTEYTVGDLFIVFDSPFENAIQYSRALKQALAGQYEASRESLIEQGIAPDWDPTLAGVPDSPAGFIAALRSFGSRHHRDIGYLVAVLMPATVADEDGFNNWLLRALTSEPPERLRLVVTESTTSPRLGPLLSQERAAVAVDRPDIDALTAAQETFAQEPTSGPAGIFRNYLISLMTLIEKRNLKAAEVKARDALDFARKHEWHDQEVAVRLLFAGALLGERRLDEAVRHYSAARKVAEKAVDTGHPAGKQLVLQTWFGEAGAHFAASEYGLAMDCYDRAAEVAQVIPDKILSIEAFRMGAYSAARMDRVDDAVQRDELALSIGESLKPEERLMTTLPIAAVDLLTVLGLDRVREMALVRVRYDETIAEARRRADRQAEELESTGAASDLAGVESELDAAIEQIAERAANDIDALAASANEPFRDAYARSRELLGDHWPLLNLMPEALGVAVPEAESP